MGDRRRPSAMQRLFSAGLDLAELSEPPTPKPRKLTAKEKAERRELAEQLGRLFGRLRREGRLPAFTIKVTKRKATPTEWAIAMERAAHE